MKGMIRSLKHAKPQNLGVVKQRVAVRALAIQVDGATGVGFGTAVLGGLPQGNILLLAAAAYLQFTKASTATGIQATFDGDYAVGTTATADATLSGTDVNIVASSALGAATGGVSPMARGVGSTSSMVDNTDGSLELNLNLLIDDANISADDQDLTVTGIVDVAYIVLGDD